MKTYSPYATEAFRSNLIVMPRRPELLEPPHAECAEGLAYALPAAIAFWAMFGACVYFGIQAWVG